MKRFACLLVCICGAVPLQAQGFWRHAHNFFKAPSSLQAARSLAMVRAENAAARAAANPQALSRSFQTLKLLGIHDAYDLDASSFVLQETYQGKKYLWGITVSHYYFRPQENLTAQNAKGQTFPVRFVAQGNHILNDVALFELPPEQIKNLTPLELAAHPPRVGEKLHSLSFFDDAIRHETGRIVQEVHPHQIITSLQVQDRLSREGACGGPVLNSRNEVVGIHAGSSHKQQIGFVVPAEHIRQLLLAYHQGVTMQPLVFNGQQIGEISLDQAIGVVEAQRGEFTLRTVQLFHNQHLVDFNHLEKLIDFSDADKVIFKIEQSPFLLTIPGQKSRLFILTYDLKTRQSSLKETDFDEIF